MSVISNNTLAGSSGQGGGGYEIERSLRFNSGDSSYLNKTPSSAGNRKTWTWAGWVKRSKLGSGDCLFQSRNGSNTESTHFELKFTSDSISIGYGSGNWLVSSAKFRDFSSFYHVVLAVDTTQSTASDRQKIFINGTRLTDFSTNTAITSNTDTAINNNVIHAIGARFNASEPNLNGYLADVHFIDGQALSATDFGEYDLNSVWQPIEYAGTYGTNGFKLDFNSNGQVYSDEITGSDYNSTYSKEKMFDSSLTTGYLAGDSSSVTWTPTGGLAFNSTLKIKAYATSSNITFNWSGGSYTLPVSTNQYYDVSSNVTSPITSVTWTTGASAAGPYVYAVEVDGKVLVNHNSIEADSSGNGNHWTANNLTASSGIGPGITSTVPENLTGNWTGIIGIVPSGTSGAVAVFPDGGGTAQSRGTFYWTGLTIGDTITWYGTTGGTDSRAVTGNVDETSITAPGSSLGTIQLTVNAASGSAKIDFNGTANCYGITPGPVSTEYNDFLRDSPVNGNSANDTGAGGEITGNYATMNPLSKTSVITLSNGNLQISASQGHAKSTIGISSGKWYAEYTQGTGLGMCGVADKTAAADNYLGQTGNGYGYYSSGTTYAPGAAGSSYGASYTTGDVIGIAFDADNGTLVFYKNGSSQGTAFTGLTSGPYFFAVGVDTMANSTMNFGQRPFAYTAPSGYKCLNTANLSDPTIADGSTAFDAKLYTGNSTDNRAITGYGFSPDLVWIKTRNNAYSHQLYDSVRGAGSAYNLQSDSGSAEGSNAGTYGFLASFTSDGFTLGNGSSSNIWVNQSSDSYVSWAWDAGSSNTTIAAGGLNSSVYDQSQTWSTNSTLSGASGAFDGTAEGSSGAANYSNSGNVLFSPSVTINSKLEIYTNRTHSGTTDGTKITINGTDYFDFPLSSTGYTEIDLSGATLPLTTTGNVLIEDEGGSASGIWSVRIDGKRLVDSGVSVTNVPSIASTVRANPSAGFSIVKYTGNYTDGTTFSHGLNSSPGFVIIKATNQSTDWAVYHSSLAIADGLYLNSSAAKSAYGFWGTAPTSSVMYIANSSRVNSNSEDYIAYCFAPVESYSSMGTYLGNGSADGPFVFTGMRPAFILTKGVDDADDWYIRDTSVSPFNEVNQSFRPNDSGSEYSGRTIDILSNGFKITDSDSQINQSGKTYLYYAVAEHPFKNSRAR